LSHSHQELSLYNFGGGGEKIGGGGGEDGNKKV
jgi:hypothetical protein